MRVELKRVKLTDRFVKSATTDGAGHVLLQQAFRFRRSPAGPRAR